MTQEHGLRSSGSQGSDDLWPSDANEDLLLNAKNATSLLYQCIYSVTCTILRKRNVYPSHAFDQIKLCDGLEGFLLKQDSPYGEMYSKKFYEIQKKLTQKTLRKIALLLTVAGDDHAVEVYVWTLFYSDNGDVSAQFGSSSDKSENFRFHSTEESRKNFVKLVKCVYNLIDKLMELPPLTFPSLSLAFSKSRDRDVDDLINGYDIKPLFYTMKSHTVIKLGTVCTPKEAVELRCKTTLLDQETHVIEGVRNVESYGHVTSMSKSFRNASERMSTQGNDTKKTLGHSTRKTITNSTLKSHPRRSKKSVAVSSPSNDSENFNAKSVSVHRFEEDDVYNFNEEMEVSNTARSESDENAPIWRRSLQKNIFSPPSQTSSASDFMLGEENIFPVVETFKQKGQKRAVRRLHDEAVEDARAGSVMKEIGTTVAQMGSASSIDLTENCDGEVTDICPQQDMSEKFKSLHETPLRKGKNDSVIEEGEVETSLIANKDSEATIVDITEDISNIQPEDLQKNTSQELLTPKLLKKALAEERKRKRKEEMEKKKKEIYEKKILKKAEKEEEKLRKSLRKTEKKLEAPKALKERTIIEKYSSVQSVIDETISEDITKSIENETRNEVPVDQNDVEPIEILRRFGSVGSIKENSAEVSFLPTVKISTSSKSGIIVPEQRFASVDSVKEESRKSQRFSTVISVSELNSSKGEITAETDARGHLILKQEVVSQVKTIVESPTKEYQRITKILPVKLESLSQRQNKRRYAAVDSVTQLTAQQVQTPKRIKIFSTGNLFQ